MEPHSVLAGLWLEPFWQAVCRLNEQEITIIVPDACRYVAELQRQDGLSELYNITCKLHCTMQQHVSAVLP